jgi:hypothetical protein
LADLDSAPSGSQPPETGRSSWDDNCDIDNSISLQEKVQRTNPKTLNSQSGRKETKKEMKKTKKEKTKQCVEPCRVSISERHYESSICVAGKELEMRM